MENQNKPARTGMSGLVLTLYVIAIIMLVITVYTCIVNIMYISSYAAAYGITVGSMFGDAFQYVLTGSIAYLIYAVLAFAAGKIIDILQKSGMDKSFTERMARKAAKATAAGNMPKLAKGDEAADDAEEAEKDAEAAENDAEETKEEAAADEDPAEEAKEESTDEDGEK